MKKNTGDEIEETPKKKKIRKKNDNNSENNRMNRKNKKEKKKMNKVLKVILIFLLILILLAGILFGVAWWYINDKLGQIQYENIDKTAIGISEEVKEELSGYRNIAILGIDSRADDYSLGNRSDCIIIASINRKTNDVKMFSVYRDTYLLMDNSSGSEMLDKITHAYSYEGAQNTLKALNTNLDLNIEEVVTVNFDAVVATIDAVGGIDLYIDGEEVKYINKYIDENIKVTGKQSSHITKAGNYHLDGIQALAYSRIRYTAGGDYKRTERMRTVIEATMKKAKTLNAGQLNTVADTVLPRVRTNIAKNDIIALIPKISSFNMTESIGWPYETKGITLDRWYGVPITLESNVTELHKKLFGQEDYQPSEKVKDISQRIVTKTGYTK